MPKTFNPQTARKAINWAKRTLGIEDWSISLAIKDTPPDWAHDVSEQTAGYFTATSRYKLAHIWVNEKVCRENNLDPFMILFHECLHVMEVDVLPEWTTSDPWEFSWNKIGVLMAEAYHAELNPVIPKAPRHSPTE